MIMISTFLNDSKLFSWKELLDHPGNEIDQCLEKKLIFIDRFTCIVK